MFKSAVLIALSAVASAENGIWDRAMDLVDGTLSRAQRQVELEQNVTNQTVSDLSIPLPQYAENAKFFAVDYCSRYHCRCYKFFSSDASLKQYNNQSWNLEDKGSARPGCFTTNEAKKQEVCMWDNRVCNCQDESFFELDATTLTSGLDFLYPRTFTLFNGNDTNTSNSQLTAQLNLMRSTRSSSTENQCIHCQHGFHLSGGHCYLESGASPALIMSIFIGLVTIPSIAGAWYVLHGIEDNGAHDLPDYDEKKNY